ncbi:hypothetical protein [Actinoplanes sp. NPDC049118]
MLLVLARDSAATRPMAGVAQTLGMAPRQAEIATTFVVAAKLVPRG